MPSLKRFPPGRYLRRLREGHAAASPVPIVHGRSMTRGLVECLLILVSVGVGYLAAQYGEYRQERELAATVLRGLQREVESNLALLEPQIEVHERWEEALLHTDMSGDDRTAYEVMFASRPGAEVTLGVPLSSAAWNMAVTTGALRLFDYEVAVAVSEIYEYQLLMTERINTTVLASLYTPAVFDPGSNAIAVRMLWGSLAEVTGNEKFMRDLYRKHLATLQQATID